MKLDEHPTVQRMHLRAVPSVPSKQASLDAGWLKQLVLDAGADDVGFVEIGRPALDDQRHDIFKAFPHTKTLISFVVRLNREAIRTPARSVSNTEFHQSGDEVNAIARRVVQTLEDRGIRAMNPAMGFPMEMDRFPGKAWVVAHKPVAVAAGLGMMGIHRNVIHEKFGNFILLGTILVDAEVSESSQPINYNPCLECKLCVAACPVGAISPAGDFHFSACYTHNYREFMGGFTDWVEQVADSKNARDYRQRCRVGLDVAESVLRGELQIGVLSGGLPGRRRRDWAVPRGSEDPSQGNRAAASREGRDDLRHQKLRRRGTCRQTVSPQKDQARGQQPAAEHHRGVPERTAARLPARQVGGIERHLPLHLHRP
jgi:ferredoxin